MAKDVDRRREGTRRRRERHARVIWRHRDGLRVHCQVKTQQAKRGRKEDDGDEEEGTRTVRRTGGHFPPQVTFRKQTKGNNRPLDDFPFQQQPKKISGEISFFFFLFFIWKKHYDFVGETRPSEASAPVAEGKERVEITPTWFRQGAAWFIPPPFTPRRL